MNTLHNKRTSVYVIAFLAFVVLFVVFFIVMSVPAIERKARHDCREIGMAPFNLGRELYACKDKEGRLYARPE